MTTGEKFDSNSAYGPAFDQPDHSGETKSYIICFVPRSGSWLLCDLLHASGVMGVPAEYFNMNYGAPRLSKRFGVTEIDSIPIHDYLKALKQCRPTPNGVFGVKIEARQLEPLIQANALPTHFFGAKIIFISRKDVVAQGVSYEIAKQTRQWQASPDRREAVFDERKLRNSIDFITRSTAAWDKFFSANNIQPHRVEYDSLVRNRTGFVRKSAVSSASKRTTYSRLRGLALKDREMP